MATLQRLRQLSAEAERRVQKVRDAAEAALTVELRHKHEIAQSWEQSPPQEAEQKRRLKRLKERYHAGT